MSQESQKKKIVANMEPKHIKASWRVYYYNASPLIIRESLLETVEDTTPPTIADGGADTETNGFISDISGGFELISQCRGNLTTTTTQSNAICCSRAK